MDVIQCVSIPSTVHPVHFDKSKMGTFSLFISNKCQPDMDYRLALCPPSICLCDSIFLSVKSFTVTLKHCVKNSNVSSALIDILIFFRMTKGTSVNAALLAVSG